MSWPYWVLLWTLLVLGAVGVFGLIGRSLWRKVKSLTRELGQAGDRLSAVAAALEDVGAARAAGADGERRPPTAG